MLPMKLAIGKRSKLLLLGIPVVLVLAASLYMVFHKDALQEDFDKIQVGMTPEEMKSHLRNGESLTCDSLLGPDIYTIEEPESALFPGRKFYITFNEGTMGGVTEKHVYSPTVGDIWNHWKRQLGL